MSLGRALATAAFLGSVAACAGTQPAPIAQPGAIAVGPALSAAQLDRLHQLAPDYLARAERAEQRASEVAASDAAREHHDCALLLLEAAQAEADRVELERKVFAEELRRDAVLRELAQVEYERLAEKHAAPRTETLADIDRTARAKSPDAQRMAADAYIRRARLSLAAATALGAEAGAIAQAERRVREAGDRPVQARAALEQAERVLDAVRARNTSRSEVH